MFHPMNREISTPATQSESVAESQATEPDLIQELARLGMLNTPGDTESERSSEDLARLVDEVMDATPAEPRGQEDSVLDLETDLEEQDAQQQPGLESLLDQETGDQEEPALEESGSVCREDDGPVLEEPVSGDLLLEAGGSSLDGILREDSGGDADTGDESQESGHHRSGGDEPGSTAVVPEDGVGLGNREGKRRVSLARIEGQPGYPGGGVSHVTERQARWISERLRVEDDLVACGNTGVSADEVLEWRSDPAFSESIASYLTDKRGAFRPLTAHLLPLAWQVIQGLMLSEQSKDRKEGLKLLLQTQGLLVNVQETTQSEEVRRLIEGLNKEVPVEIIDVKPR